ncbi:acyl-CoA thioesterase [Streptomyces sp. NPDC020379]|uniref:acyl-CoA thioesterase n=1 Tax=Streptomyces sp. NPDC020379 TaxID=3365071 RepID=UPI0037A42D89
MTAPPLTPKYGKILPPTEPGGPSWYAIDHVVTFGETSMAGFVYYLRLIEWQGHLREMFALELARDYMNLMAEGRLVMLTQSVSCEYHAEIRLGELISLRLTISWLKGIRCIGDYAYYRTVPGGEELVASGQQMWTNTDAQGEPAPWPQCVLDACHQLNIDTSQALTT